MIKIENFEICGLGPSLRGMRNPLNSWSKSDSVCLEAHAKEMCIGCECYNYCLGKGGCHVFIGPNDRELAMKLINAGSDHRKFLRHINVYVDITAPLYWWKEFDTYKIGTVANSCSTMHTIHKKEFEFGDFSHEHLTDLSISVKDGCMHNFTRILEETIRELNLARILYLQTNNKQYWWQIIQLLPSSYNQKRTVELNYEVLRNMYFARKNHKLDEWREFCKFIESVPYSDFITT